MYCATSNAHAWQQVKDQCLQTAHDLQCGVSEEQTRIPFTIEVSPDQTIVSNGQDNSPAQQGEGSLDASAHSLNQV